MAFFGIRDSSDDERNIMQTPRYSDGVLFSGAATLGFLNQPSQNIFERLEAYKSWLQETHERKVFPTGSTYDGSVNKLGMTGFGKYTFPHGVIYEGSFKDGEFDGKGTLFYPKGQKMHGTWAKGELIQWQYEFADGLRFDSSWNYCKYPDRRFYKCLSEGLRPAGRENISEAQSPRKIPEGCYDAGEGFYNPKYKCMMSAHQENKIIRIPTTLEEKWIIENSRKAWDEATGYKYELYKHWLTGRKQSTTEVTLNETTTDHNINLSHYKL